MRMIYALGCVIGEIVLGKRCWNEVKDDALKRAKIQSINSVNIEAPFTGNDLKGIQWPLVELLHQCWGTPERRPSAARVVETLCSIGNRILFSVFNSIAARVNVPQVQEEQESNASILTLLQENTSMFDHLGVMIRKVLVMV